MTKKPFNLEEALAGKSVVTRDGRPVTEIRQFRDAIASHTIAGVLSGNVMTFTSDGKYSLAGGSPSDLFMATETKTAWANMYSDGHGYVYPNQGDADEAAASNRIGGKAIPFTYEA